jgi:predicted DsbA family dithiol-disulfide isomerase
VNARVTLHAATPTALADQALAALIRACAQETAEIQGVAVPTVALFDDRLELSGAMPMPILLAIAGEVRRSTGRWHLAKHGSQLWQGE